MPNLLIELFSEEIPARMQSKAAEDLKSLMTNGLVDAGLTYGAAACFATPRRLTLHISDMLAASPPTREERKGPRADAPEKALEGFLRSTGLSKDDLEVRPDKKGDTYFAIIERDGQPAADIVAQVLESTIRAFPWPKSMRWGSGTLRWVRPLHSILAITTDADGHAIVPLDVDGIKAADTTQGHRFMASGQISVSSFDDYETKLKRAYVMLRADERAEEIRNTAEQLAFAQGLEIVDDPSLLREVAGLVEHPVVLMGDIAEDFLGLPPEVLQTSMKEHQKFFSVRNPKTGRIEKFVTVANSEANDGGAAILVGNQKVLAARLSDAKFFWENDLRAAKAGMGDWLDGLSTVVFHNKMGTEADRIARITALAETLAPIAGAKQASVTEAARVAKADLNSQMVYEFPELQGVMGRYYAQSAGLGDDVAAAAQAHYAPLGPSDDVPTAPVSVAVALADKLDKLTGFWAIDEKPTGSKDPFALRRAALGVIRIVLENDLRMPLVSVLSHHSALFDGANGADLSADLLAFIHDRLKVYLKDQKIAHDVIDSCAKMDGADDLALLVKRTRALSAFLATDDGENLVQGYRRAMNILSAEEKKDGVSYELDPDPKLAENDDEKALFQALGSAQPGLQSALEQEDFSAAMTTMAALRQPIDAFFEATMINSDNQIVRRNRLCLLNQIRTIMTKVADFSALQG